MRKRGWALGAVLGVSLALNGWWCFRPGHRGGRVDEAVARVRGVALDRCRAAVVALGGWSVRQRVAWPPTVDDDTPPTPAPTPDTRDPAADRRAAPPEVERELCDITNKHMRDEWRRDRDKIGRDLRHALEDVAKQRGDEQQEVARAAEAIGIAERDRADFERAYLGLRRERVDALLDALDDDEVDYAELHANAVELFREQDDLVRSRYGAEALGRFRSEELRGRALILAILASTAEVPWEEGVAW